jgi:tetratricopeptide (TPR) repeat protein
LENQEFAAARADAEKSLTTAKAKGDSAAIVAALTDLGAVFVRANEAVRGLTLLEEALRLVQPLGDPRRHADVLGNLALANHALSLHSQAIDYLNRSLELSRQAGDLVEEKMALTRLGNIYSGLRECDRAAAHYERALTVAHSLGDRQAEADLNWQLAVIDEEANRHEQAILRARQTASILKEMHHPHADWFANHVEQFRAGKATTVGVSGLNALAGLTGVLVPGAKLPEPQTPAAIVGPGLLRMAYSAAKSLTKFLGSGLKTVPVEQRIMRLQICHDCEHHTGVRCRVCGCFTSAKTWLPHERCPLGKW